jgi:MFS family permease
MDTSSELIHSLLPIFMVTTLGASMTAVGLVEGIAEATALIVRIFSGALSDYWRKRKSLTLIGYGLAALTKPLFPMAHTIGLVLTARFMDRVGKGIRGAPRDALIGDLAPLEIRGRCFGLRQSMDTVGAFLGPLLAILGMIIFADNIRIVLWLAVLPALIAVILLAIGVKEPETQVSTDKPSLRLQFRDIHRVGWAYWHLVIIAGILTLARFSEAFLILKGQEIGMGLAWVPLVLVLMNLVYSFAAYPAGILSDRIARKTVLLLGIAFLIIADLFLAFATNYYLLALGIIFWGLHMAFSQGLLATLVTDSSPPALRGTAYGVFNFVCGMAMLLASVIAGVLWDQLGPAYTFLTGLGFASVAGLALIGSRACDLSVKRVS